VEFIAKQVKVAPEQFEQYCNEEEHNPT
jgi:hypothetical protein